MRDDLNTTVTGADAAILLNGMLEAAWSGDTGLHANFPSRDQFFKTNRAAFAAQQPGSGKTAKEFCYSFVILRTP